MSIENFFAKEGKSFARSILQSNAKKGFKSLFAKFQKKSPETIQAEVNAKLGYPTIQYTVDKNQNSVFKSSVIFFQEWLMNCPYTKDKIIKDEESGSCFFDGEPIASQKVNLINRFISQTGIKNSASLHSNFDGAVKLIGVSNYTGTLFRQTFSKWTPANDSVIDSFLPKLFGEALETDAEYSRLLFRKWIIGAAKRITEPGIAFDGCLIFTGPPAVGKTSFFRELLPAPFQNRTGEVMGNIKNPQKLVEAIVGKSIVCFDELSAIDSHKVQDVFKQLISSRNIDVRLPWRRDSARFLLRCAFGGNTNKGKFIRDSALSRRLWTIKLNNKGRINFDFLNASRRGLWEEALYLADRGESYLLASEEQKTVEEYNKQFYI